MAERRAPKLDKGPNVKEIQVHPFVEWLKDIQARSKNREAGAHHLTYPYAKVSITLQVRPGDPRPAFVASGLYREALARVDAGKTATLSVDGAAYVYEEGPEYEITHPSSFVTKRNNYVRIGERVSGSMGDVIGEISTQSNLIPVGLITRIEVTKETDSSESKGERRINLKW